MFKITSYLLGEALTQKVYPINMYIKGDRKIKTQK